MVLTHTSEQLFIPEEHSIIRDELLYQKVELEYKKGFLPVQLMLLLSTYPLGHWHSYPPMRLTQVPAHPPLLIAHSLTSVRFEPIVIIRHISAISDMQLVF